MSLHCPKCGKDYKEDDDDLIPKVLKCGDTLCIKCIQKIYESNKMTCPLCSSDIDQKIEDLPTNKYVFNIKKSILCDKCLEEYSNTTSGERVPKILKCGDTFCLECITKLFEKGKGKFKCPFCGIETTEEEKQNMPDNLCIIYLAEHELYTNVKYLSEKSISPKELGYLFSLGLMGEAHGGKTSITHYFHTGESLENSISTIGYDFHYKFISINNKFVKVNLLDTAGQERFGSLAAGALRGVHGLLLVVGLTIVNNHRNYEKWKHSKGEEKAQIEEEILQEKIKALEFWLEQFYQFNQQEKRVIYLIGNKIDDKENRIIKKKDVQKFAEEHELKYFETSAKTGQNIYNVFENLILDLIKIYPNKMVQLDKGINKLVRDKKKPKSNCC